MKESKMYYVVKILNARFNNGTDFQLVYENAEDAINVAVNIRKTQGLEVYIVFLTGLELGYETV